MTLRRLAGLALATGLAAPCAAPAAPAPAGAPSLMSATFAVSDLDRALAFYTRGLGLSSPARIENAGNTEVPLLFAGGGPSLLLIRNKAPDAGSERPPRIGRVILAVPDLRGLAARLAAAGYPLAAPVAENPRHHVLVALVKDPDGNELELVQR